MKNLLIGITLSAAALCGASYAAEIPAKPADTGKAYVYKTSGGKERQMEIFFPPNHDPAKSKVPGMIFFHGGAWLGGSLAEFRRTCAYFASRGLVCATVDYQMLKISKAEAGKLPEGETHKRVCVIDAKSAIRWFKQHADELGIDPSRIITGGTSAGGHISALATMNPDLNDPADPKDIDTTVVAYIWVNPAFSRGDSKAPEIDLMHHLKADLPPAIVFFGENDNWKKGWDIAYVKWKSLGTKTIDLEIAPGEGHGFWNHSAQWQTVMLIATDNFLVKHGFLTGEPTLTMPESGEKFIPATDKLPPHQPRPTGAQERRGQKRDFLAANPATLAKIQGGLVVQLGDPNAEMASELANTGRYIIHLLDTERGKIEKARTVLHERQVYGVASAETVADYSHLPYTENLINLIVAGANTATAEEIFRVLVPKGALVITHPGPLSQRNLEKAGFEFVRQVPSPVNASQKWIMAHKPWPDSMGHWTHTRHEANGNAVSPDTAVGEPKRIRWIAGHSGTKVPSMVSDGGRNFYGHAVTRDSFNGMRLWHRDLTQAEETMDPSTFTMKPLSRDLARPVATEKHFFAVAFPTKNLVALDSKTGEIVRSFPEITAPQELIHHQGTVVAICATGIYAFNAETGAILWKKESSSARTMVAGGGRVSYLQGQPRRGEKSEAVTVDLYTGKILWKNSSWPWLKKVQRSVLFGNQLAYEVSSFSNSDLDNGIYIVSAEAGELSWKKTYAPGMTSKRQARAMFIGDDLWIQQGGTVAYDDKEKREFHTVKVTSLDRNTGETKKAFPAGLGHCAPPIATVNMIFSGVVEMTDLKTGNVVINAITKSTCSRDNGFTPANGLIYATPKHCTCWPMLRGYLGIAPEHPGMAAGNYPPALPADEIEFRVTSEGATADANVPAPSASDWPMYRHDVWRSSSSTTAGPKTTSIHWSTAIAPKKDSLSASSPLRFDWDDNPFVKGRLTPPTIANGRAFVARPDAHEVVAVETASGKVVWRFTARGRIDTPPTIHKGLAIFGDHGGYVHAIRIDDGKPVWRIQAAPVDERIGAYGQIESAWPVAGSVLPMDDDIYFVAGRQALSDGGVFIFSVDAMTGKKNWVKKLNSIPQKGYDGNNDQSRGFYKSSALEFDPVDLLHKEGDRIAMSRWLISLDGKEIDVDTWNGFAELNTGAGTVFAPRGTWTYGARHIHRIGYEAHRRPLCVYRDNTIIGALNSTTALYRRDFDIANNKNFNRKWITGWEAMSQARNGQRPYRSDRIAEKASWKVNPWAASDAPEELLKPTTEGRKQLKNKIYGMVMDSRDRLYVVHEDGTLKLINTKDGSTISESQVPAPIWDGLAIAENRLYLSTEAGELVCIGER